MNEAGAMDMREKLWQKEKEYYTRLIATNISNPIGRQVLKDYAPALSGEEMTDFFNMLDDGFKSDSEMMEAMEYKNNQDNLLEKRNESVGTLFTDFKLTDPEGNEQHISDYTGKTHFLFIDFWASWCGPCIQEIPGIKEVYEKYKDKRLEVLSISLDNNKKLWKSAMNKQNMPWSQLCDLNGGNGLREVYHFKGIPYGLLLDKAGKIIAVDVQNGEILERILKQVDNKFKNP